MNIICKKSFGNTNITINKSGQISIISNTTANYGIIYQSNISAFKEHKINSVTGYPIQVIGMDFQPAKTHINYIESKIQKGFFDHLIPKKLGKQQ